MTECCLYLPTRLPSANNEITDAIAAFKEEEEEDEEEDCLKERENELATEQE